MDEITGEGNSELATPLRKDSTGASAGGGGGGGVTTGSLAGSAAPQGGVGGATGGGQSVKKRLSASVSMKGGKSGKFGSFKYGSSKGASLLTGETLSDHADFCCPEGPVRMYCVVRTCLYWSQHVCKLGCRDLLDAWMRQR